MRPEQQLKALAELDGWKFEKIKKYIVGETFRVWSSEYEYKDTWHKSWMSSNSRTGVDCADHPFQTFNHVIEHAGLKPYLTSYDAIIPLIQKQEKKMFHATMSNLFERNVVEYTIFAPPAQLAEALLRAVGKWKE